MANKKYLDQSGLNYLWQKIKYGFASVGASGFATDRGILLADGSKGITGSAYTLGGTQMGSGATVLATEQGVSGAIASAISSANEKMVTADAANLASGKIVFGTGDRGVTGSSYSAGTGSMGSGEYVLATEAGVSGAIASAVEAGVSGKVGSTGGFSAADRVVLTDGTGRDIHQTSYTLGTGSMGSGATVLATEAGVSGAIAAANANMVTASSNFAAEGQVLLAGGTNKTAKTDGYTIGGTQLVGTSDKVLATEMGVSGAINSAISALQISGVTGDILSIDGNKKINTTLSLNYASGSKKLQILGKDGATVVSEIDVTDFVKDGMLEYARLHVRTSGSWSPALPEGITEPSGTKDGTYIVLNWNTQASKSATFINVTSLIDEYTADEESLHVEGRQFSAKFDNSGDVTFSKSASGIKGVVTGLTGKADKVSGATAGNFAGLDANGNLTDSGKKASDFADADHNHDDVYLKIADSLDKEGCDRIITAAETGLTGEPWWDASQVPA